VTATSDAAVELPRTPYLKLKPGPGRPAPEVALDQRERIHAAMIDLVGERGYEKVTARALARLSGVSTRSFYKHFESKEDCFACTHQMIANRVVREVIEARAGESSWRERLRVTFDAFTRELARDPWAGRLLLIDVYVMGPEGLRQLRRLEQTIGERIEEGISSASDREDSSLLVEGMVSGLVSVARSRLLAGREAELPALAEPLADWALSLRGGSQEEATDARRQISRPTRSATTPPASPSVPSAARGERALAAQNERALLLSAVARLVAAEGYEHITERAIYEVAGSSRRSFAANFDDVEDCILTALDQRTGDVLARAAEAQAPAPNWANGIHRAIASICSAVSSDPVFASLHFDAIFATGVRGVEHRDRLKAEISQGLWRGAPAQARLDGPAVEASIGAVWSILGRCVADGRAWLALRLAPALAYLVLAPAIGSDAAVAEISRRNNFPGSSSDSEPTQSIEQQIGETQSCTTTE
jgi:AcrR family transcriptional regulator